MIEIVTGTLINEDKFLIGQRTSDNPNLPNYWELPGGKIDPTDETPDHAIKREWKEELDIDVTTYHLIPPREMGEYMVYPFLLKYQSGKAKMNAHQEVRFITFDEINDYKFTSISQKVIHIIKNSYKLFFNKRT